MRRTVLVVMVSLMIASWFVYFVPRLEILAYHILPGAATAATAGAFLEGPRSVHSASAQMRIKTASCQRNSCTTVLTYTLPGIIYGIKSPTLRQLFLTNQFGQTLPAVRLSVQRTGRVLTVQTLFHQPLHVLTVLGERLTLTMPSFAATPYRIPETQVEFVVP